MQNIHNLIVSMGIGITCFFTTTTSIAGVCGAQNVIFDCKTKNQKHITVCQQGSHLTYRFGHVGKQAEKTITRSTSKVKKTPWNGIGSSINQSVGFQTGKITYSVFSNYDRSLNGMSTERVDAKDIKVVESGGVMVEKNGNALATVMCKPKTMTDNISDVF